MGNCFGLVLPFLILLDSEPLSRFLRGNEIIPQSWLSFPTHPRSLWQATKILAGAEGDAGWRVNTSPWCCLSQSSKQKPNNQNVPLLVQISLLDPWLCPCQCRTGSPAWMCAGNSFHLYFFYFKQSLIFKKCRTGTWDTWIATQWIIIARNIEVLKKSLSWGAAPQRSIPRGTVPAATRTVWDWGAPRGTGTCGEEFPC